MIAEKKRKAKTIPFRPTKIPKESLTDFIGPIKNLFKIDAIHLFSNKFRVNVWTKEDKQDTIIPVFKIHSSYFVALTQSGEIINETKGKWL